MGGSLVALAGACTVEHVYPVKAAYMHKNCISINI